MPTGSYSLGFARPVEAELAETLGIDDIPSLVLLKNGKLHLRDAEGKILSHPQDYPWPTISMVEAFAEEDMAVCILFDERSGPAEIEAFVALATERMGSDWKFVRIAKEPGDLTRETDPSEAAEAPDTDASKEEEFHAVRSVLSFLTRQYSHALANSTKVVAIAGDRRHAWAFGWDGGNPGEAEITKEGLANWLDSIDAGKAVAVPARSLSETSDSYEEDEDDSDWEEEDTEEYDSEAEGDMQELHAQLEMLMAQMGGASGDREQQLRGLLSMLSPGSMGGAGGAGIEELLSGMRAANIAEVDEEDIGEEEWADEEEGPGRGGSSESEEGGRQPEALGSGKGKERAIE